MPDFYQPENRSPDLQPHARGATERLLRFVGIQPVPQAFAEPDIVAAMPPTAPVALPPERHQHPRPYRISSWTRFLGTLTALVVAVTGLLAVVPPFIAALTGVRGQAQLVRGECTDGPQLLHVSVPADVRQDSETALGFVVTGTKNWTLFSQLGNALLPSAGSLSGAGEISAAYRADKAGTDTVSLNMLPLLEGCPAVTRSLTVVVSEADFNPGLQVK